MSSSVSNIRLYHGARSWDGPPEVQRGRAKRTEHGPGIYLTTSLATAKKYAKGGGRVKLVTISSGLRLLDDAKIKASEAIDFVRTQLRKKRKEIIEDIERHAGRIGKDTISLAVIVTLAVNHDALVGDASPALARFLVSRGVDATVVTQSSPTGGDEDWLVLFNPEKIVSIEEIGKNEPWDLPLVRRGRA